MTERAKAVIVFSILFCASSVYAQTSVRTDISLNDNWLSIAGDNDPHAYDGFENKSFSIANWIKVNVPHNWDAYEGYRRLRHGNRHGYAWYRRTFSLNGKVPGKRYFLFFEGVGSYATVWVNGKKAGVHAGGRTTFTLDVTHLLNDDKQPNLLAVRADHPAGITDLPWVCGGCSDERGFSEGSQPMGIFRPVHLIITNEVRVEPFGVHIWNDTTASEKSAKLHVGTTYKNYSNEKKAITITQRLLSNGRLVVKSVSSTTIGAGSASVIQGELPEIKSPHLWSLQDAFCYTLVTEITENGKLVDVTSTPYGIRWISWPVGKTGGGKQFLLNGKPVFINGIAEYEHLMGASHAFSEQQVKARVQQIKAVGFNAFRDAHQPHNLRYQYLFDSLGLLWWTQLSAHVWYDSPQFRQNFKNLLEEWVVERRNSPSLVLWGLQNESKLPEDFARECTELIRELDPTASFQRKVTTCNGGAGTDWDVPQNWTGTYGGDPATYAGDVIRQQLIGEYGAWRTIDLHTEGGYKQNGALSEDRMTALMELKVRLAESVKDSACGQFFWLYTSHDNPGRVQSGEGYRELDRIGPVNYKGLLTPWEEPLDAFYMFRANYAPKETAPMVYIVSHTWPGRWKTIGKKDSIIVYSNCDEVELFNDVNDVSLGKRNRKGIGTHFQWDGADINYNVLYAVGYVNGKKVATDYIVLQHLPQAPHFDEFFKGASNTFGQHKPTKRKAGVNTGGLPKPPSTGEPVPTSREAGGGHKGPAGVNTESLPKGPATGGDRGGFLYRVNCGGPDYIDANGHTWMADREKKGTNTWGAVSWTKQFEGMPSFFASQRQTYDPIQGTTDWPLFQTFRYGLQQLRYEFPVPDGDYLVELYFTEPWWGTGGGIDCTGWRLFDVAINNKTEITNLDIWKEAGHDGALKKTLNVQVTGGVLQLSFPRVAAGQAIISAIAIATGNPQVKPAPASPRLIENLVVADKVNAKGISQQSWLNTGDKQYEESNISFSDLPANLYGADWIRMPLITASELLPEKWASFTVTVEADVFIALDERITQLPGWLKDFEDMKTVLQTALTGKAIGFFANSNAAAHPPSTGEPVPTSREVGGGRGRLYRKRFPAQSTVSLGPNGKVGDGTGMMYTVMATPVTTLQPAFDLKPVTAYKMPQALVSGEATIRQTINNRDAVVFGKPVGGSVAFTIDIGVADMYSLSFRYYSAPATVKKATWQLLAADGTVMKTEKIEFTTTREGKWNYFSTTTGTMINAGKYTVRITAGDAEGVAIGGLDVQ